MIDLSSCNGMDVTIKGKPTVLRDGGVLESVVRRSIVRRTSVIASGRVVSARIGIRRCSQGWNQRWNQGRAPTATPRFRDCSQSFVFGGLTIDEPVGLPFPICLLSACSLLGSVHGFKSISIIQRNAMQSQY